MTYQPPGEYAHLFSLRYDFSPSEPLKNELEPLFASGTSPDFLMHSTKEAYVDGSMYLLRKYEEEARPANEAIKKYAALSVPIAGVALRRTIQYGPKPPIEGERGIDTVRFSFLIGKSKIFDELNAALNNFPDMVPRVEPSTHHLYFEIPSAKLAGLHEEDEHTFNKKVAKFRLSSVANIRQGLFSASVAGLSYSQKHVPVQQVRPGWRTGRD